MQLLVVIITRTHTLQTHTPLSHPQDIVSTRDHQASLKDMLETQGEGEAPQGPTQHPAVGPDTATSVTMTTTSTSTSTTTNGTGMTNQDTGTLQGVVDLSLPSPGAFESVSESDSVSESETGALSMGAQEGPVGKGASVSMGAGEEGGKGEGEGGSGSGGVWLGEDGALVKQLAHAQSKLSKLRKRYTYADDCIWCVRIHACVYVCVCV